MMRYYKVYDLYSLLCDEGNYILSEWECAMHDNLYVSFLVIRI